MTRDEYRLAYREARKADRFYIYMRDTRGTKVTSMFDTLAMCPDYRFTRLYGDLLRIAPCPAVGSRVIYPRTPK